MNSVMHTRDGAARQARLGVVLSCYLHYAGIHSSTLAALTHYGEARGMQHAARSTPRATCNLQLCNARDVVPNGQRIAHYVQCNMQRNV